MFQIPIYLYLNFTLVLTIAKRHQCLKKNFRVKLRRELDLDIVKRKKEVRREREEK